MKKAPKDRNLGSTTLIPKDEWAHISDIQGTDETILKSATMEKAYRKILEVFKPKKKICVMSLCTVTRPYSLGKKWKTFKETYGQYADLIINSSGGVIPIEYEMCYPFLTYDGAGGLEFKDLYIETTGNRVKEFLMTHKYDYVVFNFRHNLKNVKYAYPVGEWLKENGYIKDFKVLPTIEMYEEAQKQKFHLRGYKMFPELYPCMMAPVIKQLRSWSQM